VYIDDLLLRLSSSAVGCYLGLNFVGALAYADDIVLLAPTPSAMRILLQICDSYAAENDINFNPDKSKFVVIPATKRRHLYNTMCKCCFFVGNKMIDNVDRFSHVGHVISLLHLFLMVMTLSNDVTLLLAKSTMFCAFFIN